MLREWKDGYLDKLRKCAEELFNRNMPVLTEEKFALTEKTGNRIIYEEAYFARRKYMAVFGTLAICDTLNRHRYLLRLEDILNEICEEECWALPAHVDRESDEDWRVYVDLFASETAEAFAEIIYYLGNELSGELVAKMRCCISKRVMQPYLEREPYDSWERSDMNWNAVCNGCIGIIALYLMDSDKDKQRSIIGRVCENLKFFIDGYADDGTCYEGLGYFSYGFYYYLAFMTLLSERREYRTDVYLSDKCRKIAQFQQKCYFPSGVTLSFSDGYIHDRFHMGLTCCMMELYEGVEMPNISMAADFDYDGCYRFLMIFRDYQWTERYIAESEESVVSETDIGKCIDLPEAQWGICHASSGGGMACKGGNNDEPHNHNDIGNFFFLINSDMMFTDLGAGEYTKQYFSDERYDILCNNSFGHNVPIVNGEGQKEGRDFACDRFEYDGKGDYEISMGGAYDAGELKKLERRLNYDLENEVLSVEDTFESDGCLIEENLVTQQKVTIEENGALVESADHACRLLINDPVCKIRLKKEKHYNHEGEAEDVTRIMWQVADKTDKGVVPCRYKIEKVR